MYTPAHGLCYQIVPKFNVNVGIFHGFYIAMNNILNDTNDMPESVEVIITSESNSYGLTINSYVEGNTLVVSLTSSEKPKEANIDLKPTQYKMFKPTSNCDTDLSYYKCLGLRLLQKWQYRNCTRFCIPITYQTLINLVTNDTLAICETSKDNACMVTEMSEIKLLASTECSKSCTMFEYAGKVKYINSMNYNGIGDWYMIFPSSDLIFTEEYLIYDFTGMVGSIGGALGMFIGLSFMDIFFHLVNFWFRYNSRHRQLFVVYDSRPVKIGKESMEL